ncbi:hypothetical protein PIB30_021924, partial [Stylosanthes scabra]|nr:hypothetical protein [Stylosanthes scabra]
CNNNSGISETTGLFQKDLVTLDFGSLQKISLEFESSSSSPAIIFLSTKLLGEKKDKEKSFMANGFEESTTTATTRLRRESNPSPSCSGNNGSNDAGDFECNICFDLAQDPVITLCGHLFCWPCLYRWLHHHSQCQECPVCKALVQEEKLVPLYGRGKTQTDPRTKTYPGMEVPRRPSGQRPETAPQPPPQQPGPNLFGNYGFGLMGGFIPMATATFGNFTLSTAFGGFIPSLLNIQFQPFHDATVYGTTSGYPFGFTSQQGGNGRGFSQAAAGQELRPEDNALKNLLLLIGLLVLFTVIFVL